MLDRLATSEETCVERFTSRVLLHDLIAFLEDALDRLAGLRLRAFANHLEDRLKSIHMPLGLVAMSQESGFQLLRFRSLR